MTDDAAQAAGVASPIADLSYRTYDGTLHSRTARWWIVALSGIRMSVRKAGFWIAAAIAILPYMIAALTLFIKSMSQAARGLSPMGGFAGLDATQKYAGTFFDTLSNQQVMLLVMALIVGSGSIAADNRTNALQVYLAKPITKLDYLVGKWAGVFLTLFAVTVVPGLFLYLYCLLSFLSDGFLKNEPWLIGRMILAAAVPATIHASLICGCSAWSRTPRMAGAVYAALFFASSIISGIAWGVRHHGNPGEGILLRHLSIEGVINGLTQNIYGVTQHVPTFHRRSMELQQASLIPPSLGWMLLLAGVMVVIGVAATRARIRAVEVVRG
jgi:ABC-2 type transport system permease protein